MKNCVKTLTALALVCMMLIITACSLVSVNEDRDNAQVVAKVNGVAITKSDFRSAFDEIVYYYSMFGMQITEENLGDIRMNTMDSIVMDEVLKQKAKELGFDKFTAEEQAELDKSFDELWQTYLSSYKSQAEAEKETDPNVDVDKRAEELLLADMAKDGMTKDSLIQSVADQEIYTKLRSSIDAEVTVSEDEIKADYDKKLADQKAKYAETPESYESDESSSGAVAYIPPGYIRVKHILIAPADDDEEQASYDARLEELGAEQEELASEMTALIVEDKTANQAKIDELEAQINAKKAEQSTMREQFLAKLRPEADEALQKARSGENFDALIETYGKDPGMKSSPEKETGYLISEKSSMVPEFIAASFALMNPGDISDLVESEYGYHIIRLEEKVASRDVPLEEIREAIQSELMSSKQSELWTQRQDEWKAAAKVETFPDIVKDVGAE